MFAITLIKYKYSIITNDYFGEQPLTSVLISQMSHNCLMSNSNFWAVSPCKCYYAPPMDGVHDGLGLQKVGWLMMGIIQYRRGRMLDLKAMSLQKTKKERPQLKQKLHGWVT